MLSWLQFSFADKSGVRRYRFDGENLDIQFHGSVWVYRYQKVPVKVFEEFQSSARPASYVSRYIKGRFEHLLLTEDHIAKEDAELNIERFGTPNPTMKELRDHYRDILGVGDGRSIA